MLKTQAFYLLSFLYRLGFSFKLKKILAALLPPEVSVSVRKLEDRFGQPESDFKGRAVN